MPTVIKPVNARFVNETSVDNRGSLKRGSHSQILPIANWIVGSYFDSETLPISDSLL